MSQFNGEFEYTLDGALDSQLKTLRREIKLDSLAGNYEALIGSTLELEQLKALQRKARLQANLDRINGNIDRLNKFKVTFE